MKIAHLLPCSARFPLVKHNGRYEWALRLAQLQAAAGHEVVFYAAPGSTDDSGIGWRSVPATSDSKSTDNLALWEYSLQNDHDIYHSHFDDLHYFVSERTRKPIVFTQHWFPNQEIAAAAKYNTRKNVYAVPPTEYMFEEDKRLGIDSLGAIHHGINLDVFKPAIVKSEERFVFVGRISPRKGVLEAIHIAKEAGIGLDIVGKINDTDRGYWAELEPLIDGRQIRYLGAKKQDEIVPLFQQASALLFPSQKAEAFGLVIIEAQACGTPVIISDVGAASELVMHQKTGFVVNSRQQYIEAIKDIGTIDRKDCREFAKLFDINKMADKYYGLYESLVSGQR